MLERMWSKGNTPLLLVGLQNSTDTVVIIIVISQKIRYQLTSQTYNITFGHIPKGDTSTPQGHLLNYVHSNIIHNRQILETTKMPLSQRMDKVNVAHSRNGELLRGKKQ